MVQMKCARRKVENCQNGHRQAVPNGPRGRPLERLGVQRPEGVFPAQDKVSVGRENNLVAYFNHVAHQAAQKVCLAARVERASK